MCNVAVATHVENIQNLEVGRDCLPVGPLYLEAGMPMKIYEAWYLGEK